MEGEKNSKTRNPKKRIFLISVERYMKYSASENPVNKSNKKKV